VNVSEAADRRSILVDVSDWSAVHTQARSETDGYGDISIPPVNPAGNPLRPACALMTTESEHVEQRFRTLIVNGTFYVFSNRAIRART